MFSFEEYILSWSVYLLSVSMLMLIFWQLTRCIHWFYWKQSVRLLVAVIFLVPASVEDTAGAASGYLAPAWVKALLQLIFSGMEGFLPVARLILLAVLAAFVMYLLLLIAYTLYRRRYGTTDT